MMMKINKLNAIGCLLLLTPWDIEGQIVRSSPQYQVRSAVEKRDLQEVPFNPLDMMLSFSDDGAEREDEFYLDIFDTPDILTNSDSPMVISNAMNFFLLEELNALFDDLNEVEKVSSEIVHLKTRNGTYVNASSIEDSRVGTESRMKVTLTFAQTPSPATEDVEIVLKFIMSDLSYFVTNLTSSVSDDNELKGVYVAIRREIRPTVLVQPPDQNIVVDLSGGLDQGRGPPGDSTQLIISTVPIVVGVAVLVAVVVFFVFKKRKKPIEPVSIKDSEMMYDVENEVFSMDRSVESTDTKSPAVKVSRKPQEQESSIQYSISADSGTDAPGCDSIFSGISTDYASVLSPKSLSGSMMTGFTCASASTIRASNLNNNKNKKTRPKSPAGNNSIFNFLDPIEDADEEDADDLELMERAQPTGHEMNKNAYSGYARESADVTKSNLSVKSKEKDQVIEVTKAPSTNPVSHVLADLENMETSISSTPRDPTPTNMTNKAQTKSGINPTPRNNESPVSLSKVDEKEASVTTRASNLMSGFFKGMRTSDSTPNSPTSSPTNGGTLTAPVSPMQQVGRHWLTSPEKNPSRRIPMSPKVEVNIDYDMMLSHPSPTEEDYNNSSQFNDSINDSMQIIDKAPQDHLDLDPLGGRRHAGDKIGGDGSALYQASAMKPTDWSVKSSDAGSVGSSTIDDEASQNQTSKIACESKKSVSASRQLINDLVWLEKKIATVRGETKLTRSTPEDSVMYDPNRNQDEAESSNDYSCSSDKDASNIVCRDCFAPPGKLQIVIHSTKDGPAVHTVKDGSSLEGEILPGDLIISVDNIDTRTCTAEEVMKMMASKGDQERKITVLRFLEDV
jgi:hypothetical protein